MESAPCTPLALTGGRLLDGSGRPPVEDAVVVVHGETIQGAGSAEQVAVPDECRKIDVHGMTILPGLMDLHVHLALGTEEALVPAAGLAPGLGTPMTFLGIKGFAHARRTLRMGFTTLRDVGDMGWLSVALRDAIEQKLVEGPRIIACGQYLTTTGGHGDDMPLWLERTDTLSNAADGVDNVLRAVRRQIKMKTDWIKFFATGGIMDSANRQEFTDAEMRTIIDEAHERGKRVAAHCMHAKGTLAAVKAGLDTVEHGSELTPEINEEMNQQGTFLIPTLYAPVANVNQGRHFGLPQVYMDRARRFLESGLQSLKRALEAGVRVGLGTDCGYTPCPHGTNARELELLVQAGMTPMESLVTATKSSAEALGLENRLGTVESGKTADLLVVRGNPLDNICLLQDEKNIFLVMKDGIQYV